MTTSIAPVAARGDIMNAGMVDPALALALAVYHTKGGYAILLGSGVSRAAGIPTGWEIIADLVRRVAALEQADVPADPSAWYERRFGAAPNYSTLLETLAKTPAERRELLRGYFEPSAEEREDGRKRPTDAHRAIARLVAGGFVRVVVTTNFDQLLETALRDEGVAPAVVSTADAVAGMMPLHLAPATVVKVHGDYLDTRIKNTPDELARYPRPFDRLLDRIFDEYGLIVCGWSATWDDALRAAITRCPSRRFTTFWAARGEPTADASALIEHRRAQVIPVESADAFFGSLAENVATLADLRRPHPTSTAVAVATLKRYIPVAEHRIRLHDLVMDEVERVRQRMMGIIPAGQPEGNAQVLALLPKLEAAAETVMALFATGTYWSGSEHRAVWVAALERLGSAAPPGAEHGGYFYEIWNKLYRYPAQLGFYAAGLGAVAQGKAAEETLADVLLAPQIRLSRKEQLQAGAWALNLSEVIEHDLAKQLPGMERRFTPFSDYLFDALRGSLAALIPEDAAYAAVFDRFEYMVALACAGIRLQQMPDFPVWAPIGRLAWRLNTHSAPRVLDEVSEEIQREGASWLLLRRGLFGGPPLQLEQAKVAVDKLIRSRAH
jgi:hypothetical protein